MNIINNPSVNKKIINNNIYIRHLPSHFNKNKYYKFIYNKKKLIFQGIHLTITLK